MANTAHNTADGAESEEMARQREEKKAEAERLAHECDGGDDDETALELKLVTAISVGRTPWWA